MRGANAGACSPHARRLVRPHSSRCRLAKQSARSSTNLKASLSQHVPVFIRTVVGVAAYLCPRLVPALIFGAKKKLFCQKNTSVGMVSFPHDRKHLFSHMCACPTPCFTSHIGTYNSRISTHIKISLSPGNASQRRPVFIRTIVGIAVYFCPNLMPTLFFCAMFVLHNIPKPPILTPAGVSDTTFHVSNWHHTTLGRA